ncbi:hypothetical protein PPACK8108_LOCUS5817 [Phakopsora pachyrhizi]|uniref:Uncharacterized protein n=1 Tax=Phakopsora pachyrhizi TaxID=170000 RepID=A0AAV0APM4_PHAPC|nr:hypothetical protein PPACK8108_LOCUS5817 [Phakopsora pachyrhizi]
MVTLADRGLIRCVKLNVDDGNLLLVAVEKLMEMQVVLQEGWHCWIEDMMWLRICKEIDSECKRWARLELVELDEHIFEEVVGLIFVLRLNSTAKLEEMVMSKAVLDHLERVWKQSLPLWIPDSVVFPGSESTGLESMCSVKLFEQIIFSRIKVIVIMVVLFSRDLPIASKKNLSLAKHVKLRENDYKDNADV